MEGIVTVAIGIATFFLLVDTPETAGKWLKQEEVRFLVLQRFIKQALHIGTLRHIGLYRENSSRRIG